MTTIRFHQRDNTFSISLKGHAGYNPGGPDIVCAACSTLAYTLLQAVLSVEAEGGVMEFSHDTNERDGDFYLKACVAPWAKDKMEAIFKVILDGFALLQKKYSKYVAFQPGSGEK